MKAKFELKLTLKLLAHAEQLVTTKEKMFYSSQKLWQKATKVKDPSYAKLTFQMMEKRRNSWHKAIDEKMKLEQTIKVLEKKVVADVLKEIM